ncbi:MAG: hypothetical protein LBC18_13525 [Opitutaceae bacterium]|jgi:hypothetical protein|nr:hypothetical protein [Opitutaceae bacterium]
MPARAHFNTRRGALLISAFLLALLPACSRPPATLVQAGVIAHPVINEASGLAPSRRADSLLWTHNDSDGEPVLYAIATDGRFLGSVRVAGVRNIDWEDIASFELDGRAWLLIADTGDNGTVRRDCALHVIAEPDPAALSPARELTAAVAWSIPVRYPDGPHDCESVAVDAREGRAWLLIKRENPNRLASLPLRPAGGTGSGSGSSGAGGSGSGGSPAAGAGAAADGTLAGTPAAGVPVNGASAAGAAPVVVFHGAVAHLPQPDSKQRLFPIPAGRYRGQPTAMDFAADGSAAVVLTYGDTLLFPRRAGESWSAALAREPVILPPHNLGQAEAACFSRDSRAIFVTEEKPRAPLLRYDLR